MTPRRPWAIPLVPAYRVALAAQDVLRTTGLLPTHRLRWPVVSVGSISAGGAGKTPAVIALADLLRAHGWSPHILSRGYGRESTAIERVEANLPGSTLPEAARRFGDEPALIATRTAAPVWVGADRFAAGTAAEQHHIAPHQAPAAADQSPVARPIHLLDDGFQHRQLHRDLDLVLLTAEDLVDTLLPAGNRREPLRALRRAHAIIVREDELPDIAPQLPALTSPDTPIWPIRRHISFEPPLAPGQRRSVVAFCGIARPASFFAMLRAAGLTLHRERAFPDHHRYTLGDVQQVARSCHLGGCTFLTTEKDAVKLSPELRAELARAGALVVAHLHAEFSVPEAVLRTIESTCLTAQEPGR